jgi:hypothetical protein
VSGEGHGWFLAVPEPNMVNLRCNIFYESQTSPNFSLPQLYSKNQLILEENRFSELFLHCSFLIYRYIYRERGSAQTKTYKKKPTSWAPVTHTCNPSSQEAEIRIVV